MPTVDEVIANWTPEEREKLKDLIMGSRERERQIERDSMALRDSMKVLDNELLALRSRVANLLIQAAVMTNITNEFYLKHAIGKGNV